MSDPERIHRCSKCRERLPDARYVLWRGVDPEIEIRGRTRYAVESKRVRANDEEPGFGADELGDDVAKILVHSEGARRGRIEQRISLRLLGAAARPV